MKTVDTRGKTCPIPLIMTKKAITESADKQLITIISDNETSFNNICRFLTDHNAVFSVAKGGNEFKIKINDASEINQNSPAEDYCEIPAKSGSGYIITVKRNRMGDGAEELGEILLKACINTIPELDNKPEKIIFFNSGIFMCLDDSQVIETLQKLESSGIKLLVCGTCLDFYDAKSKLAVGQISNMYDILDSMSKAEKVVFV
jgi:selenium metabolism protein YedF